MKKFSISTRINAPFHVVWENFGEDLFYALQPRFPATEVLRFDGCKIGDKVETNIIFAGIKQPFFAKIIAREETSSDAFFMDAGTKLPFFLTHWQHRHMVKKLDETTTLVTDEIYFGSLNAVAEVFLLPVIFGQLWARKPVYRKFFTAINTTA